MGGSADASSARAAGPLDQSGCNYNVCIGVNGNGNHVLVAQVRPVDDYHNPITHVAIDLRYPDGRAIRHVFEGHSAEDYFGVDLPGASQLCGQMYNNGVDIGGYPCVSFPL